MKIAHQNQTTRNDPRTYTNCQWFVMKQWYCSKKIVPGPFCFSSDSCSIKKTGFFFVAILNIISLKFSQKEPFHQCLLESFFLLPTEPLCNKVNFKSNKAYNLTFGRKFGIFIFFTYRFFPSLIGQNKIFFSGTPMVNKNKSLLKQFCAVFNYIYCKTILLSFVKKY